MILGTILSNAYLFETSGGEEGSPAPSPVEYYFHDTYLSAWVYSSAGKKIERETFTTLVDEGKVAYIGQRNVALYEGNDTEYDCAVFIGRFATLDEIQKHLAVLVQQRQALVQPRHHLTGVPSIEKGILNRRIGRALSTVNYLLFCAEREGGQDNETI